MKYILKQKIPFTIYEVGHVFETDFEGDIRYVAECDGTVPYNTIHPHEILLMVKTGILEGYDEAFPKVGKKYFYISDDGSICYKDYAGDYEDKFRLKTNNVFRTREEAYKRLKEIMGE